MGKMLRELNWQRMAAFVIVAGVAAAVAFVAGMLRGSSDAEESGLALSAPPYCHATPAEPVEQDGESVYPVSAVPSMTVSWAVPEDSGPFTVEINGVEYEGALGQAEVPCALEYGLLDEEHPELGRLFHPEVPVVVDSGLQRIEVVAQHADGSTQSGSVHVYMVQEIGLDEVMTGGKTYRLEAFRQLVTVPEGISIAYGGSYAPNCTVDQEGCGRAHVFNVVDPPHGARIDIYRHSWREHFRDVFVEEVDGVPMDDLLDQFEQSIGRHPFWD